jgi:hypothetical protein
MTGRQDDRQDDRQRILDEYMIDFSESVTGDEVEDPLKPNITDPGSVVTTEAAVTDHNGIVCEVKENL